MKISSALLLPEYDGNEQLTRNTARYMTLDSVCASNEAMMVVKMLTQHIASTTGKKPLAKLESAVGAIFADLMAVERDHIGRWCYRPVGAGDFTHLAVGYRPFTTARVGFQRLQLTEFQMGFYRKNGGEASKFKATKRLLDLASDAGVQPGDWHRHFAKRPRPKLIAKPIIRRAEKQLKFRQERGRPMPVDWSHPMVIEAKRVVDTINDYFADVRIEGAEHHGFKRIYGAGSDPKFDWDMGGRLYSLGGGYQSLPSEIRASILLRGEATIELDIKASHLTIVTALLGRNQRNSDPYEVEGIPRNVVKSWVTMCLGYGKFHQQWSDEASARYADDDHTKGRKLEDDYPLIATRETLKEHLPEIVEALAKGLGWARLQYIESCAIIDAVYELAMAHDIPALPVHDSLIVPESRAALARQVLGQTFRKHVGVFPILEAK